MDMHDIWALVGFLLASYSVIGNDSVQTLGTFIASHRRVFKWYWLWAAAGAVLAATLTYSWAMNGGDISWGRLTRIPPVDIEWYHAAAPLVLVLLTRFGVPVSTTFLVLSAFASTVVLGDMLLKSVVGYAVAGVSAYLLWLGISRVIDEKAGKVKGGQRKFWRTLQWLSTGFLWVSWLSHDMANIAVYLPRQLTAWQLAGVLAVLLGWLAVIFRTAGGKIQKIVLEKSTARFMRSATLIDLVYAFLLWFFKELNDLPMSTTWVFVGLLAGRELAIATSRHTEARFDDVFPIIGRDFFKMMIGLTASVGIVLAVHTLFN